MGLELDTTLRDSFYLREQEFVTAGNIISSGCSMVSFQQQVPAEHRAGVRASV